MDIAVRVGHAPGGIVFPALNDPPAVESGGLLTYHDTSWNTHTSALSTYSGRTSWGSGFGPVTISDMIINDDLVALSGSDVQLTLLRCKMNGHFDFDNQPSASATLVDTELNGGTWGGAAFGFTNLNGYRCWIHGANEGVLSSGVSYFEYCLMNGLYLGPVSGAHCNGFISNGNNTGAINLQHCIMNGDVPDNGSGGGVSTNCSFFPDFAPIANITVQFCYLPDTPGAYAASFGDNPGKAHNDDPTNCTNITVTDNKIGTGVNGRTTSWRADPSNTWARNVRADTGAVLLPNV